MGESANGKASLGEELARLLAVLNEGMRTRWSAEERAAWLEWKHDLIRRMEVMERRQAELETEPYLWITEARAAAGASEEIEQSERGTLAHLA